MKTELAIQQQMPVGDIMTMAKTFAESGMFADSKQAAQAFVKIQAGQEIGIAPFQAMSGIHIISGKPTIGAGIMASKIKGSGKYDYKVIEQTDKVCSIDFYQGKEKIGNSTFTIEDAKKAQTKNLDKFPKNMLFARAISNGLKWYCPDVFAGPVYVPEEMGAVVTEDITHEVVDPSGAGNEQKAEPPLVKINEKQFKKLTDRLKEDGADVTGILKQAREAFTFTEEQEKEFNQIIIESKKVAA